MSLDFVTAQPLSFDEFHAHALACGMTETECNESCEPVLIGPGNDHALYHVREELLADGETHVAFIMRGGPLSKAFTDKIPCHSANSAEHYELHCFGQLQEPSRGILLDALVAEFGIDRQTFAHAIDTDRQAVLVPGLKLTRGSFFFLYHAPTQNLSVYFEDCQVILLQVDAGPRSIMPDHVRQAA